MDKKKEWNKVEVGDYVIIKDISGNTMHEGFVQEIVMSIPPYYVDSENGCYIVLEGGMFCYFNNVHYQDEVVSKELINTKVGRLMYGFKSRG